MSSENTGVNAGASTDQHITGAAEDGSFPTDEPPTAHTPAHGSSNVGINKRHANRADFDGQEPEKL